jgi:hypothetical protein
MEKRIIMAENELDYNSLVADFDENYDFEETVEESEEVEEVETDVEDTEDVEETEETDTEDETTQEETEETQSDTFKNDKQNQAFAELRRKAQENEQAAAFLKRFADSAGVSPDEIVKRFEQKQLEQEAQKQNVPVEVLQRLRSLEEENMAVKSTLVGEKLDKQIQGVIEKYKATEDDIKATFNEMLNSGVDPRNNPNVDFEKFYKAANFDKILEAQVKEAKQTSLSQKKKRQEQAAIPNGTSTTQTGTDIDDLVAKDVKDILENW